MILDGTGRGQASSLLFKRYPFKHENEVRVIYNSLKPINHDVFKFKVDPFSLFDEIVFDPRMKYEDFGSFKKDLRSRGYKNRIVKSILNKVPKLKFKFDPKKLI